MTMKYKTVIMMLIGKETGVYTEDLIMPILTCLSDADSRVRYYACESLYNVVKVCEEYIQADVNKPHLFAGVQRECAAYVQRDL